MTTYRVAVNHNIALASLTVLDPQPQSIGVQATRRVFTGTGGVIEHGHYVDLVWSTLEDGDQYRAILAKFGLTSGSIKAQAVTIYARNDLFEWERYNGVAHRPAPGQSVTWRAFFPRDIVVRVVNLVQLS